MIGSFTVPTPKSTAPSALATMQDDGAWTCTDPIYERMLNQLFPIEHSGPEHGTFGHATFHACVRYWNGQIVQAPVPAPDDGEEKVY